MHLQNRTRLKSPPLIFFCFVRLFLIFLPSKSPPSFFWCFATNQFFKKSPFYSFWHCETFQNDSVSSQNYIFSARYIRILYFFKTAFFLCDCFQISIQAPPIFTRNETFCEHRGLPVFFNTMRHIRRQFFNLNFCFSKYRFSEYKFSIIFVNTIRITMRLTWGLHQKKFP